MLDKYLLVCATYMEGDSAHNERSENKSHNFPFLQINDQVKLI